MRNATLMAMVVPAAPAADPGFERIKALAGDWVEVGEDGRPTGTAISS